jgi:D-beta-D-heptose 7-phosphate kinase/D-beta-D-heptose 1-phosphate adenosyltransferase
MTSRTPLLVVGDALLDHDLSGRADRLAPDAPVPVVSDTARTTRPGGAALAAYLAAADGRDVTLVTALGDDEASRELRRLLDGRVRLVELPLTGALSTKTRVLAHGQPVLRLDDGDGRAARGTAEASAAVAAARAVLVSDYGRGTADVLRPDLHRAAARVPVVWDPHPRGGPPVPGTRLATPSAAEAHGFATAGQGGPGKREPEAPGAQEALNPPDGAGRSDGAGRAAGPAGPDDAAGSDAPGGVGRTDGAGGAAGPSEAEVLGGPTEPADVAGSGVARGPGRPAASGGSLGRSERSASAARSDGAEAVDGAAGVLRGAARDAHVLVGRWRVASVVVTLGERGALLSHGEAPLLVPPPWRAQGDPCGAGDRFAVTAAGLLADGALPETAVQGAVEAATRYVADGGARAVSVSDGDAAQQAADDELEPAAAVERVRRAGGTVVAAGGCFDLLHAGHVALLQAARRTGDFLVVCVNSDASVRRRKGPGRPLVPAADRVRVLRALGCVDAVAVFDEDTPERLLAELRPDIWVKGGDYARGQLPEAELVESWGGQVVLLPYLDGRSTTLLAERAARDRTAASAGAGPATRAARSAGDGTSGSGSHPDERATHAGPRTGTGEPGAAAAAGHRRRRP